MARTTSTPDTRASLRITNWGEEGAPGWFGQLSVHRTFDLKSGLDLGSVHNQHRAPLWVWSLLKKITNLVTNTVKDL